MNNSLPELTPEQLRQLNAISGLQKTRRRGADASVPSALTAESESGEAPDISASYALPKPAPNMSEEDYERQIKEGLTEHIEAIYDRARQRADARRQETPDDRRRWHAWIRVRTMRPCGNRHGLLMQNRKCYAARRLSAVKIRSSCRPQSGP